MALNILDNHPTELTDATDFFGHLKKANAIKEFYISHINSLGKNKMYALYGEWGSGKSSILKYLEKQFNLEESEYLPIFFEAWEHEKDENLALSLVDVISEKLGNEKLFEEIFKTAFSALRSLMKGIKLKFPLLEYEYGKAMDAAEKEDKERNETLTIYKKTQDFKKSFKKIEEHLLKGKKKKIIVFIDDLDRCEPENVLDLLSAIKLFFTYGDNTIFLFGVDKDAVSKAVEIRYGKTIQSDVYLEKVFDITFNMPRVFHLNKLLEYYFPGKVRMHNNLDSQSLHLEVFFKQIEFTNPRHLKKVLNKFEALQNTKAVHNTNASGANLLPAILIRNANSIPNEEEFIQTIFVLYFIILHEFYFDKFIEIENYSEKVTSYAKSHQKAHNGTYSGQAGILKDITQCINQIKEEAFIPLVNNLTLSDLAKNVNEETLPKKANRYIKMITIFTPKHIEGYAFAGVSEEDYIKQFENPKDKILVDFCMFLLKQKELILKMEGGYKFWNLFEMAKTLL